MTVYKIAKTFEFAASHTLDLLPEGHPCKRLHGHNYTVTVVLGGKELNEQGMVLDYRKLGVFGDYLKREWDHRHLNDWLEQPTAERIAQRLYGELVTLLGDRRTLIRGIRVSETAKTWAEFRP